MRWKNFSMGHYWDYDFISWPCETVCGLFVPISHPELLWLPLMSCSWPFSQVSSLTASGGMIWVSVFLLQMSGESWFRNSSVKIMMSKTRERGLFINGDRLWFHHFVIYFPNRSLGLTMWICILLKGLFQRKYSLV